MKQKKEDLYVTKRTEPLVVHESAAVYGAALESAPLPGIGTGQVVERVREGLPMAEFEALREMLGLGAEELAGHLAISRSTLARRRKSGRLDMLESDRLVRFARLLARAREVFGGAEAARSWLRAPARALGHTAPLAYAQTEVGGREVEDVLGRIEHGVFN
jgi:putative toxin-antitoxin system antitoxin component (TIGR02293 family)